MFYEGSKGAWLLNIRDGAGQDSGLGLQPAWYPACRHQCYVQAREEAVFVQDEEQQEPEQSNQVVFIIFSITLP